MLRSSEYAGKYLGPGGLAVHWDEGANNSASRSLLCRGKNFRLYSRILCHETIRNITYLLFFNVDWISLRYQLGRLSAQKRVNSTRNMPNF